METTIKVLHVEDLSSDAELIARVLRKGNKHFDILRVDSKEEYIKALQDFGPDIILADYSLPSFSAHEPLEILQDMGLQIPFILITAVMSDEFAADVIKRGADDYILKDRLERLPSAVNNALKKARLEKERQSFLDKLVANEKYFRALIENSADIIAVFNKEGKLSYLSPSVHNVLGYTQEQAEKLHLSDILHPDDTGNVSREIAQWLKNPGISFSGYVIRVKNRNGGWLWFEATVTNMLHDKTFNGILTNFHDITKRKIAEEKVVQANRLYVFISHINQTIVHATNQQSVFKAACRIAIELGGFKAAWIGLFDLDSKEINMVEEAGILPEDIPVCAGPYETLVPQAHALHKGVYRCNNIQDDPELHYWHPVAKKRGYHSCMVLPIRRSDTVVGTFNLYAAEADFFNPEEIALLEEAAGDISFSLDVFEMEKLRTKTQARLVHSEQRLKQAQEIAHFGSWELDFATGIAEWSEEALRIYGIPLTETRQTQASWLSYIHPQDKDHVLREIATAQANLAKASFFHRIIRKDGSIRYIHSQSDVEFNAEGTPVGLYGVAHDLTEIKETELALRESESNLHTIFANASEGFILTDTRGIVKAFNNQSRETILLNTGQEIRAGESIFDFVHASRKDNYDDAIAKILAGETLQYDYPFQRADGELKWFMFTVSPAYSGPDITGICISTIDITERKQAEEKLKKSESNLKAIIENTDASIYSLDTEFRYITFNKMLQGSLKYIYDLDIKAGDKAYTFLENMDPEEALGWNRVYSQALKGEVVKFERKFSFHGKSSYVYFSIYPIWEDDKVIGLSCFAIDITKRKIAEEEREKMISDIIQRNKDLQQFSYIVSHNLRAPVANMLGIAEALKDDSLDAETREKFTKGVLVSVMQIDNVIKDLNTILQVKKEIVEKREPVSLSALVEDISADMDDLIRKHEATIVTDFSEADELLTVKNYLHTIFSNLLSNSIKYRQPGRPPVIQIKTARRTRRLVITFKDNGMGIDLSKKSRHVFGLYKRFHPHIEGRGVGLFMVKTQTEALGGKISINSEPGKGTEFRIVLPVE